MFNLVARRLASPLATARTIPPMMMATSPVHRGVASRGVPFAGRVESQSPSPSPAFGLWACAPKRSMFSCLTPRWLPNNSSHPLAPPPSLPAPTPLAASAPSMQQARGFASKKHKRVIRQSKGFRGRANRCFRIAIRRLEKSWQYAYRDRKNKKREFRKLWIQRLNAGVRQYGMSYSRFINLQGKSGVALDRKILSGLAMYEPFSFKAVVDVVEMSAANGAEKQG
ncbi:hypothetical protein ACHAXT_010226 [Thalassiosira profunda]